MRCANPACDRSAVTIFCGFSLCNDCVELAQEIPDDFDDGLRFMSVLLRAFYRYSRGQTKEKAMQEAVEEQRVDDAIRVVEEERWEQAVRETPIDEQRLDEITRRVIEEEQLERPGR